MMVSLTDPRPAQAQLTAMWLGGTGDWSNGLLWVLLSPPQPGSNVTIDNLVLPPDVTLDVSATVNTLFLGTGAKLTIVNGRSLQLNANSTINGTLTLAASGGELLIGGSSLTLAGTGTIIMAAEPSNRIRGVSSGSLLSQVAIQGSGSIGDGQLSLQNQSTITATNASVPLVIKPNATGVTNTGTLRATNGATLVLKDGTFANAGGSIVADNNSHVDVDKSTISGGDLLSSGTGHFHAIDSILAGVTIGTGSNVELSDGKTLTLLGNIVNNGLLSLLATSGSNELKIDGPVTLSGTGNVVMSDASSNRITAAGGNSTLTIGSLQTVSGAGEIGRNNVSLTNLGTILASQSNPLVIDNAGGSFTNSGRLKASGSGGLKLADASVVNLGAVEIGSGSLVDVSGTFTQSGAKSIVSLAGGSITTNGLALQSGALSGTGSISGTVTAGGNATIIPGGLGSIGILTFTSPLNLGPSNALYFDLGGTTPGSGYDRLNGTSVTLDGSLFVSFAGGFQATVTPAETFTLISTSTALNGMFASLGNGARFTTLDGLGSFQVNYQLNALTISNFQPIPEPSTYVLLTVGAAGVLLAERRRRRRLQR